MNMVTDIGDGLSGLEQLRAFMTLGKRPGIGDALDFDLVEVSDGRAVFAGPPGRHAHNPMGIVHGGYIATLLDSACGCAMHSKLTAQQACTTLELKIAFHKSVTAQTGRVRAEGGIITIGRRVAFAEARRIDAKSTVCATATSTLLVMER